MANLCDLPNEMLEEVFSNIIDIRDAISLKDCTPETRAWWDMDSGRVAKAICGKTIPETLWPLSVLTQAYAVKAVSQAMVVSKPPLDAVEALSLLVAQRNKTSSIILSDQDLVSMTIRHRDFCAVTWMQERGHAQLHAAAKALIPRSSGDLDGQDVINYLLALCYAMFIAERLTPATVDKPQCRYGSRPDWYTELALGVMVDLKPSGWWDGEDDQVDEEAVRESLQMFFGAQSSTADPEGKYDYL
jgi:hypothetical protein